MRYLLIACLVLFCAAVAVSAASGLVDRLQEPSYSEMVADQVRADQLRRQNELDEQYAPVRAAVLHGALILAVLGGLAYAGGLAAAHVKRTHLERMPNDAGLLPVLASDQATARAALAAYHQTRQIAAAIQPVPQNYAPHTTYAPRHELDYRHDGVPLLPGDVAESATSTPAVASFAELLSRGEIGPGRQIVMGADLETGEILRGSIESLYSAGLGGLQGSGKSWTATAIASQAMLSGAKVLMIDPHAGDAESLATRMEPLAPHFLADVASSERSIIETLRYAGDILKARQPDDQGNVRDPSRSPVIVLVDEWTALLLRDSLRKALPKIIAHINVEGRKYGVVAELLAHRWATADTGGGVVRNTLTACYIHRSRIEEARLLSGMGAATPRDTLQLQPGQAYLVTTRGEMRKVQIPLMTNQDIARVDRLLTSGAPAEDFAAKSPGSRGEVAREVGNVASVSPEAARAFALFSQGMNVPDIGVEMGLTKSTSGAAAQRANAQVQAWLREAMGGQ